MIIYRIVYWPRDAVRPLIPSDIQYHVRLWSFPSLVGPRQMSDVRWWLSEGLWATGSSSNCSARFSTVKEWYFKWQSKQSLPTSLIDKSCQATGNSSNSGRKCPKINQKIIKYLTDEERASITKTDKNRLTQIWQIFHNDAKEGADDSQYYNWGRPAPAWTFDQVFKVIPRWKINFWLYFFFKDIFRFLKIFCWIFFGFYNSDTSKCIWGSNESEYGFKECLRFKGRESEGRIKLDQIKDRGKKRLKSRQNCVNHKFYPKKCFTSIYMVFPLSWFIVKMFTLFMQIIFCIVFLISHLKIQIWRENLTNLEDTPKKLGIFSRLTEFFRNQTQ